jgi:hypothetical protein
MVKRTLGLGRTVRSARWGYRRGDLVTGSAWPFSRDERAHR